jgi:hypothetical protein
MFINNDKKFIIDEHSAWKRNEKVTKNYIENKKESLLQTIITSSYL